METNNLQNNNEIDLLDLLKRVWQATSSAVGTTIIFLIKKSLWLALFVVIGAIVSFSFYKSSSKVYSSMMMARPNVMDNAFMINYVRELSTIQDTLIRAKALHIPDSTAKYILDIDAFYGIDSDRDGTPDYVDTKRSFSYNPKDSARKVPGIFYVQVKVNNEDVFRFISNGLTETLNTNPYIVERNNIRLQQTRERLAEINYQLNLLDSVQRVDYFKSPKDTRASSGQLLLMNEKDRQLYHDDILSLYNTKQALEEALTEYNTHPITVIRDFSALSVVDNPLILYLKFWVPVCFFLGLGFVVLRHFWKKIWKLITEK